MNYLIVDDDAIFADTLARALSRRNVNALVANDGDTALKLIEEKAVERVILDLKIGEDSGLKLLPQIKKIQPNIDVVLLTGYSSIPTAVEAIKLGALQYLCKPVEIDEVLQAFESQDTSTTATVSLPEDGLSIERREWEYIQSTLMQNDGNVSATARALGMHRRTLQRKLSKRPVKR